MAEKKKENLSFMLLVIFLISVIVCIACFGVVSWSKYRSIISGNMEAQIAKWSFKVNGEEEVFADIDLADTISFSHVEDTKIAPGTEGAIDLEIDARGTEVSLKYIITLYDIVNKPQNLKFYEDENHTREIQVEQDGSYSKTGKMLLADNNMLKNEKVYWKWEYITGSSDNEIRANNVQDTLDAGKEVTAKIKVKGIQINDDDADILIGNENVYYAENADITLPIKVNMASFTSAELYKIAGIEDENLNGIDPLNVLPENIEILVNDNVVSPTKKEIIYKYNENGYAFYDVVISGIKANGNIGLNVKKGNYLRRYQTTYYMDTVLPALNTTAQTNTGYVDITVNSYDEHIASGNEYQYYVSTSSEELVGGEWISYSNNDSIRLERGNNPELYVWFKTIKDLAGNESTYNKTVEEINYNVIGPYMFDINKPVIKQNGDISIVERYSDSVMYSIPIQVIENEGYTEQTTPTNLLASEIVVIQDSQVVEPISKSLKFKKESGKLKYTFNVRLTAWTTLELEFAEGVITDNSGLTNDRTKFEIDNVFSEMTGDGTAANPYVIMTVNNLKHVSDNLSLNYILGRNLDLSNEENWTPIGVSSSAKFSGTFNGQGYTISNLTIDSESNNIGLFGYISGSISNLNLENVNVKGNQYVGALAGYASAGTVSKVSVIGGEVEGTNFVGGLLGRSYVVEKSFSDVDVRGTSNLGGLVGYQGANISNCYSTSRAFATSRVGGLVGYAYAGTITNSYAVGYVEGTTEVGGLKGANNGTRTVTNSYWCFETTGQEASAGTAVTNMGEENSVTNMVKQTGYNSWNFSEIWNIDEGTSFAYLRDMPKPNNVVLRNIQRDKIYANGDGSQQNPYIIRTVAQLKAIKYDRFAYYRLGNNINLSSIEDWPMICNILFPFKGELDGYNYTISNLEIENSSGTYMGLFAKNAGTIKNLKLDGFSISGSGYIGALAGYNDGTISNVSATNVTIISSGADFIGGLVGYSNSGNIELCYTTGNVNGVAGTDSIGGLIGYSIGTTINKCYSTAIVGVVPSNQNNAGGLIGYLSGNLSNSFATGNVEAYNYAGGLVGRLVSSSRVENCYSIGRVTGNTNVGGLIGASAGTVVSSYWATDLSDYATSAAGTAKTAMEMINAETFVDWSFNGIWYIEEGASLPYLDELVKPSNINFSYTNANETLSIGDYVYYNPSNNGDYGFKAAKFITGAASKDSVYNSMDIKRWRVLDVDNVTGKVELVCIEPTSTTLNLGGKTGYDNLEAIFESISEVYEYGRGVSGARCATRSDVAKYLNINSNSNAFWINEKSVSNGDYSVSQYNNTIQNVILKSSDETEYEIESSVLIILELENGSSVIGRDSIGDYRINLPAVKNEIVPSGSKSFVQSGIQGLYDCSTGQYTEHVSSATVWSDLSGNLKNGTVKNATWGDNYLEFDGTSSWVNFGVMNSSYRTMEVVFEANSLENTAQHILSNIEVGGGTIGIMDSKIYGQYYIAGDYRLITSSVEVVVGRRYHVSLTYDGICEKLYIDGVLMGTMEVSGTIRTSQDSTVMVLGGNPAKTGIADRRFNGKVYFASVHNKALIEEEVLNNYQTIQ